MHAHTTQHNTTHTQQDKIKCRPAKNANDATVVVAITTGPSNNMFVCKTETNYSNSYQSARKGHEEA